VELPQLNRHIAQRALVFDDLRLVFVPVPKASCTSLMWALAETVGIEAERFTASRGREVTRELTIHDMSGWPDERRLGLRDPDSLTDALTAEGWLRFTVVRDPFRRLWSAWQSKVLLGDPQFIAKFDDTSWYPRDVSSPEAVLHGFRMFVDALQADPALVHQDVHWAPQVDLTGHPDFPLDHIGRVEDLGTTLETVQTHLVSTGHSLPELRRTNVTPIPYVDELFQQSDVDILSKVYADDLSTFGYEPPSGPALSDDCPEWWLQKVQVVVPSLDEVRGRNIRIADLHEQYATRRQQLLEVAQHQRTKADRLEKRVADQATKIKLMKADRKALRQLRQKDQNQLERRKAELQTARRQAKSLRRQRDAMRSSLSWRVTSPLRRVRTLLPSRPTRPRSDR
jgi:hypothetical protein